MSFEGKKAEDGLTERYPHSRRDLLRSYENPLGSNRLPPPPLAPIDPLFDSG